MFFGIAEHDIVVSIEIELPTALENAQLPAFSSLLQLISKRNDYISIAVVWAIPMRSKSIVAASLTISVNFNIYI